MGSPEKCNTGSFNYAAVNPSKRQPLRIVVRAGGLEQVQLPGNFVAPFSRNFSIAPGPITREVMKQLAILGGGQLARMLMESAARLGAPAPAVYGQAADEPAYELASRTEQGPWTDAAALARILQGTDVVVFENEFVDLPTLRAVSRGKNVEFCPPLDIFSVIQNKIDQKRWLKAKRFPTSPFDAFSNLDAYRKWRPGKRLHVLKWGSRGYDGKGILIVTDATPSDVVTRFFEEAAKVDSIVFAEEHAPFDQELAIVVMRNAHGETVVYPLVASNQEEGICWWVKGPASALGVSVELETEARETAVKVLEELDWEGCLAIEFFQMGNRLWINELAPRVHNTAHYSQNAAATSQFENHLRCALGLPLGSTETAPFFAMRNLLGPAGYSGPARRELVDNPPGLPNGTFFHWYGKTEVRPKRKIGHINLKASSRVELDSLCETVDKWVLAWENSWLK